MLACLSYSSVMLYSVLFPPVKPEVGTDRHWNVAGSCLALLQGPEAQNQQFPSP